MVWLFLIFALLLILSATPLLGSIKGIRMERSLGLMLVLSGIFFVAGWLLFLFFPVFS